MPSNIEERVVQMRFDNAQFERGAAQSLRTLDKLEGVLDQLGTGGGLEKIGNALDSLERRFSNFGIAGAAAISHITTQVVDLAERLLTAIPKQIIQGGTTRATNLEQAKFQIEGLGKSWEEMHGAMDYAVADTAYGLDEAAKAAAQFAASGVSYETAADGLSDMHKALRAISGVAGMTNSSYSDIAHIFTGIAGTGKVMTQDLRMLEGRGLNVAAKLAEVLRDGPGNIQYTEEQIREMVSKGEIDFLTFAKAMDAAFGDHAKKANETFTGALANMKAALSRIGADFVMPIHKGAIEIFNAFRTTFNRVRKITQPFAEGKFTEWVTTISSAIAKWADSIDFSWLEGLIYMLNNVDIGWIESAINGLTKFNEKLHSLFHTGTALTELTEDGAKTIIVNDERVFKRIENLKNIFTGIKAAGRALLAVFSAIDKRISSTGGSVLAFADGILEAAGNFGLWLENSDLATLVTEKLEKAFNELDRVLGPLGRSIKASWDLIRMAFSALLDKLRGSTNPFGKFFRMMWEGVVKVSEKLAEWLEKVRDIVEQNGSFMAALDGIGGKFQSIREFVSGAVTAIRDFLSHLFGLKEGETLWSKLADGFRWAGEKITEAVGSIRDILSDTFTGNGLGSDVLKIAGAILGVFLGYRRLEKIKWAMGRFGRTFAVIKDGLKGLWDQIYTLANFPDKISTVLSRTSGALRAFADNLNAQSLVQIGLAVLALSVGLAILASIDVDRLVPALGAVAAVLTMLVAAFAAINYIMRPSALFRDAKAWSMIFKGLGNTVSKYLQAKTIQEIAKSMMFLGVAVLALAAAVWVLSKVEPGRLWESVGAVVVIFAAVVAALIAISKLAKPGPLLGAGIAMIGIAAALLLVVGALALMTLLDPDKLQAAIWDLAGALAAMTLALGLLGKYGKAGNMLAAGVAMVGIAASMLILVGALALLTLLDFEKVKQAGIALGIGLAAMSVALGLLSRFANPIGMIAAGAAMVLLAGGLLILAAAFAVMALIPTDKLGDVLDTMVKMLIGMVAAVAVLSLFGPMALVGAGALLLVAIALVAVGAAIAVASVGLIALAAALNMLKGFSQAELKEIGKGLKYIGRGMFFLGLGAILMKVGIDAFAALIPLATALDMMQGLDLKAIGKGLATVGGALLLLGIGSVMLGLGSLGLTLGIPALINLFAALPAMTKGLKALDSVKWDSVGKAFVVLAGGAFALFLGNIATIGGLADPTYIMGNLGEALPKLADGLRSFETVSWESVGKGLAALAGGDFVLFLGNIATLGGIADPTGPITNLGAALPVLSAGLGTFESVSWESVGKGLTALAGSDFVLFLGNITTLGGAADPTGALTNLGAALPTLSSGLKSMEELSWDSIVKGFAAVAGESFALFIANLASIGGIGGSVAIVGLGVALPILATGLQSFETVSWDSVSKGLAALAGEDLLIFLGNIATLGGAADPTGPLSSFGAALTPLASGLHALEDITWETIGTAFGVLATGISSLIALQLATFADGTTQLENLGNAMIPLAGGLTALQEITWGTIAKAFTTLATGLSSLLLVNFGNAKKFTDMANSFKLIADTIRELPTDAGQSMKDFAAAIRDNKSDISAAASEMLTELSTTIEGGTTSVSASMGSLASTIITSFNGYQSSWTTLGSNVSIGIANGIGRSGIYVTRAMSAVAGAAIRTFQSRFNMHSPSKLMEELSENIPIGAGRGIQNGSGYLADSMYIAFSPALAVLDSILNSDLDYTPTIRPVVDITDAVSGANNMREMFSGINPRSIWGGIGDFGGINVDGATIDYKVQNDNVIGELRNLSELMNELGEAITNMQIVLDTGVLVGETSAQMDSQLGTLAMRKGRGN